MVMMGTQHNLLRSLISQLTTERCLRNDNFTWSSTHLSSRILFPRQCQEIVTLKSRFQSSPCASNFNTQTPLFQADATVRNKSVITGSETSKCDEGSFFKGWPNLQKTPFSTHGIYKPEKLRKLRTTKVHKLIWLCI